MRDDPPSVPPDLVRPRSSRWEQLDAQIKKVREQVSFRAHKDHEYPIKLVQANLAPAAAGEGQPVGR